MSDDMIRQVNELLISACLAQDEKEYCLRFDQAVGMMQSSAAEDEGVVINTLDYTVNYAAIATAMLARVCQKDQSEIISAIQEAISGRGAKEGG